MLLVNMEESFTGKMIEIIDNYEFLIDENSFKITSDAIELLKFVLEDDISNGSILEIGPGLGYIFTKLYKYNKDITAVEIQKKVYDDLKENLIRNDININLLNIDIKDHKGSYNYIVSNPPYFKINSGKIPENEIKKNSKFEFLLNLEDLIKTSKRLLKDENSYFYYIYPLSRKSEILKQIKINNLEIIKEKQVNKFYLIKGRKIKSKLI